MMKKQKHNLVFRAARKAGRMLFDTNHAFWFEKDLSGAVPEFQPELPVQLSYSTEETISWIRAHGERWMQNPKEFAVARAEGHVYPNIRYNNAIIGYMKAGTHRVFIDDFNETIDFPADCAFFYDIYVADEFRGRHLAQFLANTMMRYFKQRGYSRVQLHIPGWNTASLSVAHKLGFKKFACIRAFRILHCIRFKKGTWGP